MRSLTDSDITFLKKLQHELQMQDNFGTADPHYWHILEKKMVRTFEGNGEVGIIDLEGNVFFGDDITEKLVDELRYQTLEAELSKYLDDIGFYDEDYAEQFRIVRIAWQKDDDRIFPYELGYFTYEYKVAYPLFFTYKECKEHIRRYRHNYSDPHAYCIYSDRTPNFERLLDILTYVDFDHIAKGDK